LKNSSSNKLNVKAGAVNARERRTSHLRRDGTRTPNVEKRKHLDREGLICERCHAGQMVEYQRKINSGGREASLTGRRCDRCGYTELDNDEDVWSAVGL